MNWHAFSSYWLSPNFCMHSLSLRYKFIALYYTGAFILNCSLRPTISSSIFLNAASLSYFYILRWVIAMVNSSLSTKRVSNLPANKLRYARREFLYPIRQFLSCCKLFLSHVRWLYLRLISYKFYFRPKISVRPYKYSFSLSFKIDNSYDFFLPSYAYLTYLLFFRFSTHCLNTSI